MDRYKKNESALFDGSKFEIKWGVNGRFLVSKVAFKAGDVLWMERPAVALQSLHNIGEIKTCARSFQAIGTFEEQMQRVLEPFGETVRFELRHNLAPKQTACSGGCGLEYLDPQNAQQDWDLGHALLCVGQVSSNDHPLIQFKRFAIEHNEIYLLAAKVYAKVLMSHASGENKDLSSLNDAIWPFSLLMRMPWSDCVVFKDTLSPEELADAQLVEFASALSAKQLRTQSDAAFELLRASLTSRDVVSRVKGLDLVVDRLMELMNADFFFELIGMCEINCSAVSFFGPAMRVLRDKKIDEEQRLQAQAQLWEAVIEGEPAPTSVTKHTVIDLCEVLPFFDGIAIFDKISIMQHSCVPNVINKFASDCDAEVTALKDIHPGDELVHSYIDHVSSYAKRSRILQLWGFSNGCECSACQEKKDLEDREEDEDGEEEEEEEEEEEDE